MRGGHQGLCRVGYGDRKQWQPEEEEPACWEAGREGGRGPKAKPKVIGCFSFEMSTRNLGTGGNTERRGTVMPPDHDEDVELSCAPRYTICPQLQPLAPLGGPDVVIRSPQAFPCAHETGASAHSSSSDRSPASDFASSWAAGVTMSKQNHQEKVPTKGH